MATAFVNNSDYTPIANDAVTAIRAARKGVVRAALVVLAVIMCSVAVVGILIEYGHAPLIIKLIGAIVALGFCSLAVGGFNAALWQLLDLPEYQALQRERQRLGYYLGRIAAVCRPGIALEWRGANHAYKVWQARTAAGAPAGVRILVLHGAELKRYQVCRFGAELVICQTYQFDSAADAAAAFERGIIDGHSVAEVFGEDDPHVLRQLNVILEQLTNQEVIQVIPPAGGEFPTHTV